MKLLVVLALLASAQSYAACDQKTAESKAVASLKSFSGRPNITGLQKGSSFNEDKSINVILLMSVQKKGSKEKAVTFVQSTTYGRTNCEVLSSSSALIQETVALDQIP